VSTSMNEDQDRSRKEASNKFNRGNILEETVASKMDKERQEVRWHSNDSYHFVDSSLSATVTDKYNEWQEVRWHYGILTWRTLCPPR